MKKPSAYLQTIALTSIGLRALRERKGAALVVVISMCCVIGVLTGLLGLISGVGASLGSSGRSDRAIILRSGSLSEVTSMIVSSEVAILENSPFIVRTRDGRRLLSPEALLTVTIERTDGDVNLALRGVEPGWLSVRSEIKVTEGRMFVAGRRELIVGMRIAAQLGIPLHSQILVKQERWSVVGIFESASGAQESEAITDGPSLMSIFGRDGYQSVLVNLGHADQFEDFRSWLMNQPGAALDAQREDRHYSEQTALFRRVLMIVAYGVGGLMSLGALLGTVNVMYSTVRARQREIATLRAIGFGNRVIVGAMIIEALTLSVVGALLGFAIGAMAFGGLSTDTRGGAGVWSQVVLEVRVEPSQLFVVGLIACVVGLIGGFWPALRACRSSVAQAFRTH